MIESSHNTTPFFEQTDQWLRSREHLLICTHIRPDGDAVGSLLGLQYLLSANNISSSAYIKDPLNRRYQRILPTLPDRFYREDTAQDLDKTDGLVCLDTSTWARAELPPGMDNQFNTEDILNIDHHTDNQLFGNHNLIIPDATSTTEILLSIAVHNQWHIPEIGATALMTGLLTDSGGFRFLNTSATTFEAATALLKHGANYGQIVDSLYFRESYQRQVLKSRLIERAEFFYNNRLLIVQLPQQLLKELNLNVADTEDVVDTLRAIDSVEITCLLTEEPDRIRVSLRSRSHDYAVGQMARAMGGGGHEVAAGAKQEGDSLEQVKARIIELAGGILPS